MLDLDSGIHFEEIERAAFEINEELDGAGTAIRQPLSKLHRRIVDARTEILGEAGRRSFLDQFLIAALDGTITFSEMNDTAFPVAKNLNLHMAAARDEAFKVNSSIAKCGTRFGGGHIHRRGQILQTINSFHAAAASTADGFDQQRRPDFSSERHGLAHGFYSAAGRSGYAGKLGFGAGAQFIADGLDLGRAVGPMNITPSCSQILARAGRSERNP